MSPSADPPGCSQALLEPLSQILQSSPGTPLLCLGQTIFWDEPIKVVVRQALAKSGLDSPFVMAVHDTDYFARPHGTLAATEPFVILRHNGGSTRALWSAAGEISCLFGAETVIERPTLYAAGGRLEQAAAAQPESLPAFIDRVTEAWGWRGIVPASGIELLTHEVSSAEILPTLEELLSWAFGETAESMCRCTGTERADTVGRTILGWVREAYEARPEGTLSDLYQALLPRLHDLIAGGHSPIAPAQVANSMNLARFSPATVGEPRFRILDLFLRPQTRDACARAYNHAVEGSEIYTLDRFGEGTIPFDLITPRGGRGTIRILEDRVQVDGRQPLSVPTRERVASAEELARVVNDHFGHPVALVGKAITWIAMVGTEYIFIFNEGGSTYTRRTRQMLHELRSQGIEHHVHPILRLRYGAWDALAEIEGGFCLPDHYAEAFGCREISRRQFAADWRSVMDHQGERLLELGRLRRPVDLLRFLSAQSTQPWGGRLESYLRDRAVVRAANAGVPPILRRVDEIREARYRCGLEIDRLQRQLGENRRRGAALDGAEPALQADRESLQRQMAALRSERSDLERERRQVRVLARAERQHPEYEAARQEMRQIAALAELERVRQIRTAYLVSRSLEYNNRRPTGWWLPMVTPDGSWFQALCRTASAAIEEL